MQLVKKAEVEVMAYSADAEQIRNSGGKVLDRLEKPEFSIVVPVYNTEKYLNKCIDSILNQTYSNFELILVNDASTDRCRKICDEYALKDERVKVIHKNVRGGVVSARNAALFCSRGTYIYHVDSDDWIKENLLETVYKYIREWNQPDVIMFTVEMVSKRGIRHRPHYLTEGYYDKSRLEKEIYTRMLYDKKLPFLTGAVNGQLWNKVFKRDLFLKHYLKDNTLHRCEDLACIYECIYHADSMYFCEESLYFYNQTNDESVTHKYDRAYLHNHKSVIDYISEHIGMDKIMRDQISAYNVNGIIMGIFHEVRYGIDIHLAALHVREAIRKDKILKNISLKGLPVHAKLYMCILKMHMYHLALLGAKIYLKLTE